jgi:hypothetical protein
MAGLASGRLMLVRRDLFSFFSTKRCGLAGHLPLGFFQFLPQLAILPFK